MNLTNTALRNAKARPNAYKLTDGNGLYCLINQAGKYFRLDYRFQGKRKTLSLGVYPEVSLAEAREKATQARKLLKSGIDPSQYKQQLRSTDQNRQENAFETVAREWFLKYRQIWAVSHADTVIARLEQNIFPWLGSRPIKEITAPELLAVLRRIEERGAIEVTHRTKRICGQVFRYGIATGRCDRDPSADLKGALTPIKSRHMAAITDSRELGGLLRAIEGYNGNIITRCALQFAPLVFVRPGELRHMEWREVNFDEAVWRIPAEKMKMRQEHIVPLSIQAMEVLKIIKPLTGRGQYVFPSLRSTDRPMSENTVLAALRRMGYSKEEMTGHGFRAAASTTLYENGWPSDVIERQLAHAERNKIKASYNHAEHLAERRKMMQWWADHIDGLKKQVL